MLSREVCKACKSNWDWMAADEWRMGDVACGCDDNNLLVKNTLGILWSGQG